MKRYQNKLIHDPFFVAVLVLSLPILLLLGEIADLLLTKMYVSLPSSLLSNPSHLPLFSRMAVSYLAGYRGLTVAIGFFFWLLLMLSYVILTTSQTASSLLRRKCSLAFFTIGAIAIIFFLFTVVAALSPEDVLYGRFSETSINPQQITTIGNWILIIIVLSLVLLRLTRNLHKKKQ